MAAYVKALPALRFRGRPIFYGWAVVAAAFVSDLLSYGIGTVAFTVFFNPMSASLGWSRGLLSSAIVLNRLVEAVATSLLGPIVDRRGPQAVMVSWRSLQGSLCSRPRQQRRGPSGNLPRLCYAVTERPFCLL